MASKTPAGKKSVPSVKLADAVSAIGASADFPAFIPTQAHADEAEAVPKPPFAAPVIVSPAVEPPALVPVLATPPVAKKKAVAAAPVAAAPVADRIIPEQTIPEQIIVETIEPSVDAAEPTPMKEVTMDATTTAPFDNAAATDMADKAKTMFADVNAKGSKAIADINDFGKGNIEAIVESSKIAARGIEAMGQDAAEFGRRQIEGATTAFKSMSAVKSPTDFFKLQSDYVRASFDQLVAQTSKNTEAMLKLAGEVAQPVSNRVAVAVEKAKIAA